MIPDQRIEPAISENEWIRSETPAKLRKGNQLSASERRSAHFSWREVSRESAIVGKAPGKAR